MSAHATDAQDILEYAILRLSRVARSMGLRSSAQSYPDSPDNRIVLTIGREDRGFSAVTIDRAELHVADLSAHWREIIEARIAAAISRLPHPAAALGTAANG